MDGEGIKQVEILVGNATAQPANGTEVPLNAGAPFYADDVLQTLMEAFIGIVLAKKTLSLGEDYRLLLDEFVYVSGPKRGRWT